MEEKMLRRWNDAPEIRKIDEESRTVEFVASDNSVDSYGTVIPVDKWDLTRFASNGIIGYMHDVYGDSWTKSADPDDVIGKGEAWIEDDKLIVRITFEPADLNPKSDKIFRKLQFGSLHAVSVGFRATKKGHMGDEERGEDPKVFYFNGQELLEVSVVNIPSNANALKRSIQEEETSREYEEKAAQPEVETDVTDEAPADYTSTIARARALMAQIH